MKKKNPKNKRIDYDDSRSADKAPNLKVRLAPHGFLTSPTLQAFLKVCHTEVHPCEGSGEYSSN